MYVHNTCMYLHVYSHCKSSSNVLYISDIDECADNSTCAAYLDCMNLLGSYTCACQEGYVNCGDCIRKNTTHVCRLSFVSHSTCTYMYMRIHEYMYLSQCVVIVNVMGVHVCSPSPFHSCVYLLLV